jgi:hypothetical protein
MSEQSNNSEATINTIKQWLYPSILSVLGLFLWRDISETRSDVKLILIQQSADKVRIQKVESEIEMLREYYLKQTDKPIRKQEEETIIYKQAAKKEDDEQYRLR